MTGRERILTALAFIEPDQVPTMEWVLNPNVMEKMCGTRSDIEFVKRMGLDGIAVGLNSKNTRVDDRHFTDEWGITRVSYDEYPNPVKFPIADWDDVDKLVVPDPDASFRFDHVKKAIREIGGEKCVCARVRDVFSQPRDLMGFEGFLVALYEEPELAEHLMKLSCDYSMRICENLRALGVEVIVIGDDYANDNALLMRPSMFREMVLPPLARLVGHAKKLGLKVIKHSDGDLNAITQDLVDTGITCLDPIDARGHMDMQALKARYYGKIALKGNVDCVSTLVDQPVAEVRKATARCILMGSKGGGHIISSSNSIHSGISPVNYEAFLLAVRELGKYPLDTALLERVAEEG